ncbi:bacterial Ig-like domain-containing protein [Lentilactobacillus kribbianus]|uniref:bacterial Ig-like domain-containing protein n=1 Tax=Lentilactobacillus kribbianus TaxID=2729622 RepID=UPI0015522987
MTKIILGSKTMEIDSIGGLDEVPIPGYSTNWYKLNADGSIDYSHNWDNYTLMGNNYDPETGEPTGQRATDPGTYVLIQTAIYAHDSTIKVGQTWNKNDNLSDSYDYHGNKIDPNNIQVVAGNVDTNTPGQYVITYSYTDDFGRTVTAKATVTVVPNDDGGTTPTDPTDPDNPTTPTDPTNPTDPDNPTTPTDPTNPVEPGNPTEPNIPSTPLDPSEPNQPQPEEPSNPAMPDLPNTSVKPSNPGKQPGHDNHINEPAAKPETVNSGKNNLSAKTQVSKTAQAKLPQTNESKASASVLTVAGLVILALIGGSLGLTKKKRN